MRWIGSIQEAIGMSLQKLSRAVEDRTLWMSLIFKVARESELTQKHIIHTCNEAANVFPHSWKAGGEGLAVCMPGLPLRSFPSY